MVSYFFIMKYKRGIAARIRVETKEIYSDTEKGYIINLLAEQAAKVVKGMLTTDERLSKITDEQHGDETEVAMMFFIGMEEPKEIPDDLEQGRSTKKKLDDMEYPFKWLSSAYKSLIKTLNEKKKIKPNS